MDNTRSKRRFLRNQIQRSYSRTPRTSRINSKSDSRLLKPTNRNYKCKECHKNDHFTQQCPRIKCNRCGKNGHIGLNCQDKTYISLKYLHCGCARNELTGTGFDTHCCICKERTPLTNMEISDNEKRARCNKCAEKMKAETGTKRKENTQSRPGSPTSERPDKVSRTSTPNNNIEDLFEDDDPMESIDLQGTQQETNELSLSYADVIKRSQKENIQEQDQGQSSKKTFTNVCEDCGRRGKGINSVTLLHKQQYWNYENQRIEVRDINLCNKCTDRCEREIFKEKGTYKEQYCNRCNTKGTRSEMINRMEGYVTKYYCDLNCQYAQMIINEVGEDLRNQERIDVLINRYTNGTRYAGSSYGSITRSNIFKALYGSKKEEEPMKYDEVREELDTITGDERMEIVINENNETI